MTNDLFHIFSSYIDVYLHNSLVFDTKWSLIKWLFGNGGLNKLLFKDRTFFNHLNVHYSDPPCITVTLPPLTLQAKSKTPRKPDVVRYRHQVIKKLEEKHHLVDLVSILLTKQLNKFLDF